MSNQTFTGPASSWEVIWDTLDDLALDERFSISTRKKIAQAKASLHEGNFVEVEKKKLSMNDVEEGKVYRFLNDSTVREKLRGKKVELIKKNRTRVKTKLLEDARDWKKGMMLNGPPESLEEVD